MDAAVLLDRPSVRQWLGGVVPAWTLLHKDSFFALLRGNLSPDGPMHIQKGLSADELSGSSILKNALALLQAGATPDGLKVTATGNLTRAVVAQFLDTISLPGFSKDNMFHFNKVINEPDFFPLYFTRELTTFAGLLRRGRKGLRTTRKGLDLIKPENHGALQAHLFATAFSKMDIGAFYRRAFDGWPQQHVGLVFWCFSIASSNWEKVDRLARSCTLPSEELLLLPYDMSEFAMEAVILRPLRWFGLADYRSEPIPDSQYLKNRYYRKSDLFDRFLSFDVVIERPASRNH